MFVGWVLYCTMPAMASFAPVADTTTHVSVPLATQDHAAMGHGDTAGNDGSGGCPHCGSGMDHVPFCAACLVLPPAAFFYESGKSPRAAVAPQPMRIPVAAIPAPPEPPPRN